MLCSVGMNVNVCGNYLVGGGGGGGGVYLNCTCSTGMFAACMFSVGVMVTYPVST